MKLFWEASHIAARLRASETCGKSSLPRWIEENSFTLFDVEIPEIHPISFKEASKNPGSINRADLGLLLRSGQLVFNGAMECCGKVDDSLPQNVVAWTEFSRLRWISKHLLRYHDPRTGYNIFQPPLIESH